MTTQINRSEILKDAHRSAKKIAWKMDSYRSALSQELKKAWARVKHYNEKVFTFTAKTNALGSFPVTVKAYQRLMSGFSFKDQLTWEFEAYGQINGQSYKLDIDSYKRDRVGARSITSAFGINTSNPVIMLDLSPVFNHKRDVERQKIAQLEAVDQQERMFNFIHNL